MYLDEIRLFQNAMTLSDPEAASGAKTAVSMEAFQLKHKQCN